MQNGKTDRVELPTSEIINCGHGSRRRFPSIFECFVLLSREFPKGCHDPGEIEDRKIFVAINVFVIEPELSLDGHIKRQANLGELMASKVLSNISMEKLFLSSGRKILRPEPYQQINIFERVFQLVLSSVAD